MTLDLLNEVLLYVIMLTFSFVSIFFFWLIKGRNGSFKDYLIVNGYRIGTTTFIALATLYITIFKPLI